MINYKGYFVRVRAFTNGAAFTGILNFTNPIDLKSTGYFILTIYTFFYCPKTNCDASDKFFIKIKEIGSNDYRSIFETGTFEGRIRDNRWIRENITFTSVSPQIFV